jgi:uncharacterized protein (TIRG00374 family)
LVVGVTRKRFWIAAIFGLFILSYTIKQANLEKLLQNIGDINILWGIAVILASAASYICIAAVLERLLKGTGHTLSFSSTFKISLLSSTLNYVMAIGGLSGVAAKVYLLAREKIPPSNTLSISMVHGFLTNTVAVIFIYLGFFFLYSEYKMNTREMELGIFILMIAFVLTWVTVQSIVHENFRKRLWQILMRIGLFLSHKLHHPHWFHQERAEAFFENFNESMNLLVRNVRKLLSPAAFALLDWLSMFLCLKFAFLTVHYPIENSTLLVGFSVGIFSTIFSLTPASIGLMEGSMAGSFYLLGLDYDRALLATLIYRFGYFFLPMLGSLFFYKRFFPPTVADSIPQNEKNAPP